MDDLFNLYGKVYIARYCRFEAEAPRSIDPSLINNTEGHVTNRQKDLANFKVYTCCGCPEDHFGPVEHDCNLDTLLGLERDSLYGSQSKVAIVVTDADYGLLKAEREASARQLVGLDEGDGGRLYAGCLPEELPLELVFQMVDEGADEQLFAPKVKKLLKNLIMYFVNSKLGKLKCILPFDLNLYKELAAAVNHRGPLIFPESMFSNALLAKACRNQIGVSDFADDASFRLFCMSIAALRIDEGAAYADYEHNNYVVIKERLDMLESSTIVSEFKANLYMAKPYFLSKGDRYDLQALTGNSGNMMLHPKWRGDASHAGIIR